MRRGDPLGAGDGDGDGAAPGPGAGRDACQIVSRTIKKTFYADHSYSLTSALREALRVANRALYQHNFGAPPHRRVAVGACCAALRGADLYLAQVAPGQAYVLSEGKLRALVATA